MRNRKLIFTAIFALSVASFNSCIEDPEPVALDVISDAFIQKTVEDGEEKYGLSFWVFGNKNLESVSVDGPEDETWTLSQEENNQYVFIHYPEADEYTDSIPPSGDYIFTITSTQEDEPPVTQTDKLESNELEPVTIDSTQFSSSKLKVMWTEVEDADAYVIRLNDDSDNRIYVSPSIANNKTDYSFGITDSGWRNTSNKAEEGKTYRLEILAVLYESTSTQANQEYNIQFISIGSREIVWGE